MITFSDALAYARALKINRHTLITEFSASEEGLLQGAGLAAGSLAKTSFPVAQSWNFHAQDGAMLWEGADSRGRRIEVQLLQFNGPAPEIAALAQISAASAILAGANGDLLDEAHDQCRPMPKIALQELSRVIASASSAEDANDQAPAPALALGV
ncbi:hypothetical protein [Alcanivorax sp. 1008]|uniref:hypothetical protein n=1 Tax=Alcanivorax sp. 1008 TaxID=2816853 RepID=UPI001DA8805B|nr:hypothetical protein [Alcanivorax sp. 1008]MCC1496776.1 hypothetical protein [Alcanivorax sp. 1008]